MPQPPRARHVDCEILHAAPTQPTQKPTLLLVHGAATDARCWTIHWFDACVARGWPVAALSLRGHGGSPGRERLHLTGLKEYARDVLHAHAQIAQKTQRPPVLVGHSMGTLIVQRCLPRCDAPAAVLLSPVGTAGSWFGMARMTLHNPLDALRVSFALGRSPLAKKWYLFCDDFDDALARRYVEICGKESIKAHLQMLCPRPPARAPQPVKVIVGDRDRLISLAAARRTAAFYNTTPTLIEGLAHHALLDTHWARAADAALDWLEQAVP